MTTKTEAKRDNFISMIVKEFGEGSLVTRQELVNLYKSKTKTKKAKDEIAHYVCVEKNKDYRVSRGVYVVTSAEEPAKVKDAVVNALSKFGNKLSRKDLKAA